ncbi:MAG: hypothetical protein GC155_15405 [Alphaproteobacteria bacterium]|nr:hypothetical protein [Alphaproteobacteria bacterium]
MRSATFASLHAGLLARKGDAKPSSEPPHPPSHVEPAGFGQLRRPQGGPSWIATRPLEQPETEPPPQTVGEEHGAHVPSRSTVRMTRDRARALRLAALILDRPQQEILAEGLDLQFEELACGDLSNCACFKALAGKMGD